MNTLTGTEKQIKWASEIRAEFFTEGYRRNLAPLVKKIYDDRANIQGLQHISMEEFNNIMANAVTLLGAQEDAAFWIENLDTDVFSGKRGLGREKMLLAAIALLTTPVREDVNEITELEKFIASTDIEANLTQEEFETRKQSLIAKSAPDNKFNRTRSALGKVDYDFYALHR